MRRMVPSYDTDEPQQGMRGSVRSVWSSFVTIKVRTFHVFVDQQTNTFSVWGYGLCVLAMTAISLTPDLGGPISSCMAPDATDGTTGLELLEFNTPLAPGETGGFSLPLSMPARPIEGIHP